MRREHSQKSKLTEISSKSKQSTIIMITRLSISTVAAKVDRLDDINDMCCGEWKVDNDDSMAIN